MTAILFVTFLVLLVLGVPIAFAIAVAGVAVMMAGDVNLLIVVQRMFASTDSFPLIAVPFFILAGDLLAQGSMAYVEEDIHREYGIRTLSSPRFGAIELRKALERKGLLQARAEC